MEALFGPYALVAMLLLVSGGMVYMTEYHDPHPMRDWMQTAAILMIVAPVWPLAAAAIICWALWRLLKLVPLIPFYLIELWNTALGRETRP